MTVGDYMTIPVASRINFEEGTKNDPDDLPPKDSTEKMQAIFPRKSKFVQLFSDIESTKYLAHVRNINTAGFPNAGVEETGLFSIIISGRTGQFDVTQPATQICHLVSIEHMDSTIRGISSDATDRIGLVSLFSWTYTALPPYPVNFIDSIQHVLDGMQMLRPPDGVMKTLDDQSTSGTKQAAAMKTLKARFKSGYTIARWRTETGEESVAFNRGPLVPLVVEQFNSPASSVHDWAMSSNTSKEYQILDSATGIMDLSYSSAWQLGKASL